MHETKDRKQYMTLFLTSSPTLGWAGDLNPDNGLIDDLRAVMPHPINCVMISSFPDDVEITDRMAWELRECFDHADLSFDHYEVLDRRTEKQAARMIREANFIILCGGHVPTENQFFQDINLRLKLKKFDGVMLTISAGSMNCADVVYSSPELEGEAIDPDYKLYFRGLGLTKVNILPHFQTLRGSMLDGMRLIEDIIANHSYGHPIYCLTDGAFFVITPDRTELRGHAYKMLNGKLRLVCHHEERKLLDKNGRLRKL